MRWARGAEPTESRRNTPGCNRCSACANYIFASTLPTYQAESLRFRSFGLFDRWAQSLLTPGQHFFTGYAFAPGAMRKDRRHGGLALMDAWTSHPEEFWDVLAEEQKIWNSKYPPVSRHYQNLVVESVDAADYICVASNFVKNSFLKRGYPEEKLLFCPYPVDWRRSHPPSNRVRLIVPSPFCTRAD